MKFTPKSEKQITEENLMQPGIYDFEVTKAEDKTSDSGNEMIVLTLKVFEEDGRERMLKDYLLEKLAYKLRHAADACKLLDAYGTGTLTAHDFVGKTGRLKVTIQKDKTGQYPDKNNVADYIKRSDEPHTQNNGATELNDLIPF